ncbi:MAG: sn-glycerol-3-phosphate ABC transporter ATP-binding protein UgpC [Roseiarcus sp.]|jgi:multiple sugar transport system ATP-binding protein
MAQIVFENVSKRYPDGLHAVRSLDLAIEDGEFLVLVGPSGCGKSTALRMVAGLEDISEGKILVGGVVANDLSPRDRNIAMVFQSYALYPHLTVAENIGFGLRVRGVAKPEIAAKVKATAQILELSDYLGRKPAQLSGGQRQRVAMGRAIVREPHAFLMDEPLSNLDARLRVQMRAEIARIQRMTGVTTIYVTHDQIEAMTMGDRVAVMNHGVLQQLGPPRTLYHEPANLFVASFIGSPAINLLEGKIMPGEDGYALALGTESLTLPPALLDRKPAIADYVGRTIAVGLRPEALTVGAPEAPRGSITGIVAFVEDLGASLLVHFDIDAPPARRDDGGVDDDAAELASHGEGARVRAMVNGFSAIREGDRLPIAIDLERLHLFDRKTGLAIGARAG